MINIRPWFCLWNRNSEYVWRYTNTWTNKIKFLKKKKHTKTPEFVYSPTLFHIAEGPTHSSIVNNHVSISQYNILNLNLLIQEFSFLPLGSSVKPTNKWLGWSDLALDYIQWNGQYSFQYSNPAKVMSLAI